MSTQAYGGTALPTVDARSLFDGDLELEATAVDLPATVHVRAPPTPARLS